MKTPIPLLLTLVVLGSACGTNVPSDLPGLLDGREFILGSLTAGGEPRPLVPGTQVRMGFEDGSLSANAGCNHMGAPFAIDSGRLVVGEMSMTAMGCDAARHRQDEDLAAFLSGRPSVSLDGDELVLQLNDVVAVLHDAAVVEPEPPLAGTNWELVGLTQGDTAVSVPQEVVSRIQFGEDGSLAVEPGCNSGTGTYEPGDGTLTFGPIALTRMACPGAPGDVEGAVLFVLNGQVDYSISQGTLTLRAGEQALQYAAR
jgi:heat shock protein HslJ